MKKFIFLVFIVGLTLDLYADSWVDVTGGTDSYKPGITDTTINSTYFVYDSSGYPHVVWVDWLYSPNTRTDVFYARYNGSQWVSADGGTSNYNISSSTTSSSAPDLVLDTNDRPHVAYIDKWASGSGKTNILYMSWDGSQWIDSSGGTDKNIRIITNTADSSQYPSLDLDQSGKPVVAWQENISGDSEIYCLRWDGGNWVDADGTGRESINISSNALSTSDYPNLKIDGLDNIHISWSEYDGFDNQIYYRKYDGAWSDINSSGVIDTSLSSEFASLYIDSANNPHLAWYDRDSDGDDKLYYFKWDGSAWVDYDGTGQESGSVYQSTGNIRGVSLKLNSSDKPLIAFYHYYSFGSNDVYVIKKLNGQWTDMDGDGLESIRAFSGDGTSMDIYQDSPGILCDSSGLFFGKWDETHMISGAVTNAGGVGGINMSLTGDSSAATVTAADGSYSFSGLSPDGSYTVTPSSSNYTFSPVSKSTAGIYGDLTYNFTATLSTYTVSGFVKLNSTTPMKGVTLTITGSTAATTLSAADGSYSFTGLPGNGSYTITPSSKYYQFSPVNISTSNLSGDLTAQDFTGSKELLNIGGTITYNSQPLEGVTVTRGGSGGSGTTVTDSNGEYQFINLEAGDLGYIMTPTKTHYEFTPTSKSTIPLTANITDFDFTASITGYRIWGRVIKDNVNQVGVTVNLSGDVNKSTVTQSGGFYYFYDVPALGSYTVTPQSATATFNPVSASTGSLEDLFWNVFYIVPDYDISGYVKDVGGEAIKNVTVKLSGDQTESVQTNSNGYYAFTGLASGGTFKITPEKENYTFSPKEKSITTLSSNLTGRDFTGELLASEKVVIQGGSEGYIDPGGGEKAKIIIRPKKSGTVKIRIYNLRGQMVWDKSVSSDGSAKTVEWACENASDDIVASGIYVVHISGGGLNETKKLAVIK